MQSEIVLEGPEKRSYLDDLVHALESVGKDRLRTCRDRYMITPVKSLYRAEKISVSAVSGMPVKSEYVRMKEETPFLDAGDLEFEKKKADRRDFDIIEYPMQKNLWVRYLIHLSRPADIDISNLDHFHLYGVEKAREFMKKELGLDPRLIEQYTIGPFISSHIPGDYGIVSSVVNDNRYSWVMVYNTATLERKVSGYTFPDHLWDIIFEKPPVITSRTLLSCSKNIKHEIEKVYPGKVI